jgi:dipeptidase E
MRLYLSSYLWGNHPEKLVELLGDDIKKAALITNSADQFPEDGIVERLEQDQEYLKTLGIESDRLDLRDYFNKDLSDLKHHLKNYGLIWVRGANVFVLRRAMAQSGFDKLIGEVLDKDQLVYGGYSAGACVMGSTLRGLDLVDDALIAPEKYNKEIIWDGLGILPYAIAPHYKSEHPETKLIGNAVDYFQSHHIAFKTLRDGQAIVIKNGSETILG